MLNDLAAQALDQPETQLLDQWYDAMLRAETGIGAYESQSAPGDLAKAFGAWCATHQLRQKVCVDWNLCGKLKAGGPTADLVLALATVLLGVNGMVLDESGAINASVLILRHSVGRLCDCE